MSPLLKAAALAAALASATPAAATVLRFDLFTVTTGTPTLYWSAVIDFGDFGFDIDVSGVTAGITLTPPPGPFETGTASYRYSPVSRWLFFDVVGQTTEDPPQAFSLLFGAECVPRCDDGRTPSIFAIGGSGPALNRQLFDGLYVNAVTDLTPIQADPPAPIPLPAAGWLLLGGLGALGAMRRRWMTVR